jgi:hypothetical protein
VKWAKKTAHQGNREAAVGKEERRGNKIFRPAAIHHFTCGGNSQLDRDERGACKLDGDGMAALYASYLVAPADYMPL